MVVTLVRVLSILTLQVSLGVYAIHPTTPRIDVPDAIKTSWGAYSPYYGASKYVHPPQGCSVNQVNLVQRHGARYPTSGATERIQSALEKLSNASSYNDSKLDFLKDYTYDLGVADLVRFGAAQSFDAGQTSYERYHKLVNATSIPFVRASGSTRVVDSSTNWTAGFTYASGGRPAPTLNLVLDESLNDTLDDSLCPNVGDSDEQTDAWQSVYTKDAMKRLNAAAQGANLTGDDVTSIISLCAFDTVAKETPSQFCNLFTQSDFDGFEYYMDLDKYYGTGYGQELGPVQGVGYINELIARLTDSPVRDNTQTNRTLDSDPSTFPLGRTFYADFSHDNQMVAIYSAMGLFRQTKDLNVTRIDRRRTWVASRLVPFSAQLVTERLDCFGESFVRILVDDAVQDISFCGASNDGLCQLDAFVASQGYATSDGSGDFEKCFS